MTRRPLTDRDFDTLHELAAANRNLADEGFRNGWARAMDAGGWNGSHHSATLKKLVARGLVMASRQSFRISRTNMRPGIGYWITPAGIELLKSHGIKLYKGWPTPPEPK